MDTPNPPAEDADPCGACGAPLQERFSVFSPEDRTYRDLCGACVDALPLPGLKEREETS